MCLSTVFRLGHPEAPLAKNVALVRERDGKVLLTDILGVTTEIEARISRVDLMENEIYLEGPDPAGAQ